MITDPSNRSRLYQSDQKNKLFSEIIKDIETLDQERNQALSALKKMLR